MKVPTVTYTDEEIASILADRHDVDVGNVQIRFSGPHYDQNGNPQGFSVKFIVFSDIELCQT